MDQQPCISNQLWLGYSDKTLSQPEIDMIHHHAETCEVCADIKDGIDEMAQPKNLGQTVSKINNRIDEIVEPKRQLSVWWYWSAAAVLIFGIGLSWFWVNTTQPIVTINTDSINIARNTEEKSEIKNKPNSSSSEPEQKEIPLAINENHPVKQITVIESKDREDDAKMQVEDMGAGSMDDLDKATETKNLSDSLHYVITPPVDTVPRGVTLAFDNLVTAGSYNNTAPPSMESYSLDNVDVVKKTETYKLVETSESESSDKKRASSSSRKKTSMPAPMSNSNTNGASNTYAISKYLNLNDSANLALAKTNFNQNNFNQCLESLKNITANPASLCYEEGLLLKAKALIKQKKNKEAKVVLRIITSMNSEFKNEAESLLKELK